MVGVGGALGIQKVLQAPADVEYAEGLRSEIALAERIMKVVRLDPQ